MADIKKIKIGSTTYNLRDDRIITLVDSGSTTAGTWVASTESPTQNLTAYTDGQVFLYKVAVAGGSTTTTLNIDGLGAKTVYRAGTTKATTQYAVDQYILLVYTSKTDGFNIINDADANSYAYLRQYQHGDNAAGATGKYPLLARYNLTNKSGTYDTAYSRYHTKAYVDTTTGDLYSKGTKVSVEGHTHSYNNLTDKPVIDNTNQKVKTGSVTFGADDTVEIAAGSNVTVTGNATNKKITIAAKDTTYSNATTSAAGLMSATDKSNLDTIVESFTSDDGNTTIDTVKEVLKAFENAPEGTNIANTFAGKSNVGHTHEITTESVAPQGHTHTVTVKGTTGANSGTAVTALTGVKVSSSSSAAPGGHKHNYDKTTGIALTVNTAEASGRIKYAESISGSKPTLGGTTTFVTGVTEGSGHLESYDAATDGTKKTNDGARIKYVDSISAGSVSGTGKSSAAPSGHTHTHTTYSLSGSNSSHSTKYMKVTTTNASKGTVGISGGSGSLTSDTTSTNGILYVEDISNTAASASGTAKAGSETHTHSYTKPTGVSLGSNTTASGGIKYIEDVSHTAASLTGTKTFNTDAIKNVTLSASDTSTDGPAYVESVSHTAASLTGTKTFNTDAIKSVTLSESTTSTDGPQYIKSVSGGSGSLASYDATTGGNVKTANGTRIPYIHNVTHTPASLTGTTTFVTGINQGSGDLTSDTTSTDGIPYIASASHTAASLGTASTSSAAPGGHTHSYEKTTSVALTGYTETATGRAKYVESISGSKPTLGGTTTFVSSISGGSGHLKSYNASTNGTAVTTSGRIQYVHSLSKGGYTPAGTVTLTDGTAPSMNFDTGTNTDIPYISAISGGSAVSKTTKYMKFSAGTTPPSSATFAGTEGTTSKASGNTGSSTPTFTGSAVTSGGASTTTTSSAGAVTTTSSTGTYAPAFTGTEVTSGGSSASSTGSAGSGTASQKTGSTTPTFTGSEVTSGAASTSTTSASSSVLTGATVSAGVLTFSSGTHTHTLSHTHKVTAAGSVGGHTHTYTKPAAHTHTMSHTHSVTAAGSVEEHSHTYYAPAAHTHTLSHTHSVTAAGTVSSHSHSLNSHTHTITPAGTVTFTPGTAPSMNFNTGSSSDTPYISAVSGGSAVSKTVKYMKFNAGTTPKASASFSGTNSTAVVTGGTTYYLDHGHTGASGSTNTVTISGGEYSATTKYMGGTPGTTSTATGSNSGTNFNAVTGYPNFSGGSGSHTTKYLHHTHTPSEVSGTGTVGISGGSISKTTYYLAHGHTAASGTTRYMKATGTAASTGTVGISGGSITPTTKYMKATAEAASTGTVGISGGSISKTTKYFHPSVTTESANTGTPSATTSFVTGVTGGTTTATTKYLHHTHTAAKLTGTTSFNTDAIKAVSLSASDTSTDGPAYVDTVTNSSLSLTSTANGGTTSTNSGTAVSTISGVSYTAPAATTYYLDHEHTPSTEEGTGTVTISGGSYSATAKYLSAAPSNTSTETTENSGTNFNAATAVAANGTASVAPSGHTHSYGSTTALTTSEHSGEAVEAVVDIDASTD